MEPNGNGKPRPRNGRPDAGRTPAAGCSAASTPAASAYTWYEHPEAPTMRGRTAATGATTASKHCKNLFFRNHKGNRHYLVCFDCRTERLAIHDLEHRLQAG